MKKIIVTDRIRQNIDFELFPEGADVEVLTAYSNEDALNLHRRKSAHLILVELYGSGINAVQFCSRIREAADLRRVSVLVCCRANEIELSESGRCKANGVITLPFEPLRLRHTVYRLLNIPQRGEYRARFSACSAGQSRRNNFDCEIGNISVTGMLIEAGADLNPGDKINCSLALPAAAFDTQLEIVRVVKNNTADRNLYGVRFSRLDPSARRAIEILVEKSPCR